MELIDKQLQEKLKNILDEYNEAVELCSYMEIMTDKNLYFLYQGKINKFQRIVNLYYALQQANLKAKQSKLEQNNQNSKEVGELIQNIDLEKQFNNSIIDNNQKSQQNNNTFQQNNKALNQSRNNENMQEIIEIISNIKVEIYKLNESVNQKCFIEIESLDAKTISKIKLMFENYLERNKSSFKSENIKNKVIIDCLGENNFENLKNFCGTIKYIEQEKVSLANILVYQKYANEVNLDDSTIQVSALKSSGAGGQHINKTLSAIRIKHLPTNISVVCQKYKSQMQNKKEALLLLTKKVENYYNEQSEKLKKEQQKKLNNAINSNIPTFVFDETKNIALNSQHKSAYSLSKILKGDLLKIIL